MGYSKQQLWDRFQKYYTEFPEIGLALDLSRMSFRDDFFSSMEPCIRKAFRSMAELEKGANANPDDKRMVGHYWLRKAPTADISREISANLSSIKSFAADVHSGKIRSAQGPFKNVLLIGIGGSAWGPQFVANTLGSVQSDMLSMFFLDTTDPLAIDNVLSSLRSALGVTICVVVSKSGGTKETRNGMLEAAAAYKAAGLDFGRHTVAVTSRDGLLDKLAVRENWLARTPM
jgi:glucose-6-phosphate isomerase